MNEDEITYKIRAAVFEVQRILGPGFLEKVYENALMIELKNQGLRAKAQVPLKVKYKGDIVGEYFADILVEDKVIIELKAQDRIEKVNEAQILNYLKATGIEVGLLVNFRYPKADIKRYLMNKEDDVIF